MTKKKVRSHGFTCASAIVLCILGTSAVAECDGLAAIELRACYTDLADEAMQQVDNEFSKVIEAVGPEDAGVDWTMGNARGAATQTPLYEAIRVSQTAWLAYFESYCESRYWALGGNNSATVDELACQRDLAIARAIELAMHPALQRD